MSQTTASLRVATGAIAAFDRLSPRERERLDELDHTGEKTLTWFDGESVAASHDLWVLHQWSEFTQTMGILALGYFPDEPDSAARSPQPDEHRWDNEGGRNPVL